MDKDLWLSLRSEINFLKSCQINYFTFSITAAGAVAGFGSSGVLTHAGSTTFLAPLLVILPCSLIFFDKATTISRIVGFQRLIEKLLQTSTPQVCPRLTHGWEVSLGKYRHIERRDSIRMKAANYLKGFVYGCSCLLMFTTTHKYWVINWYTFTVLSAVSLWLATTRGALHDPAWNIAAATATIVAFHNLTVVGRLAEGSYSYGECEKRWEEALKP